MGAGNTVMGDEGIGPRCVESLDSWFEFPESVELVDVGTTGLQIIDLLRDFDDIIVIDAVKSTGHPAGTVLVLSPLDLAQNQVMHSAHDIRFVDVLNHAKMLDVEPNSVVIVGIQVQSIEEWVLELSKPVAQALPIACACALDQLRNLGVTPVAKAGSDIPTELLDALENYAPQPEANATDEIKADAE